MFYSLKSFWAENIRKHKRSISIALGDLLTAGLTIIFILIGYYGRQFDPVLMGIIGSTLGIIQSASNRIIQRILGKTKDGSGYHKDGFLIIDPNELKAGLLCKGIRREDYDCEFVDTLQEGKEAVFKKDYDVLLIDGSVRNGNEETIVEVIHQLHYADPTLKSIIMVDPKEYTDKIARRLGNLSNNKRVQLLFKPFEIKDIIQLIEDRSCWR